MTFKKSHIVYAQSFCEPIFLESQQLMPHSKFNNLLTMFINFEPLQIKKRLSFSVFIQSVFQ